MIDRICEENKTEESKNVIILSESGGGAQKKYGAFRKGDGVGLVCCSDGLRLEATEEIGHLKQVLENLALTVSESPYLYRRENLEAGTARERAKALMELYKNPRMQAICDISGGNLANQVLGWLDYQMIKASGKELWGYSDLTTLLNGIYAKTGNSGWLYQLRMLVGTDGQGQRHRFAETLLEGKSRAFFSPKWRFLQGEEMRGILLGGNIRCFLKLAGTPYFPPLKGKVLFLESLGGGRGVIASLLTQLSHMGVFSEINGLLLGTFTELDEREGCGAVEELVREAVASPQLPIARTMQVGHGADSRALHLGTEIHLCRKEV